MIPTEKELQWRSRSATSGNTLEVHDTNNETTNCQLSEIKVEHQRWYDTLSEAKADRPYDNCEWCIGGGTR